MHEPNNPEAIPNITNNLLEPYQIYSVLDSASPETKETHTVPQLQSSHPPLPNAATKPAPTSDMLERMHLAHPLFRRHHHNYSQQNINVAGPSSSGHFLGHRKLTKQRSLPSALAGIAGKATGFSDQLATAAHIREERERQQHQTHQPQNGASLNPGYASSSSSMTSNGYLKLRISPHYSSKYPTLDFDPVVRVVKPNQTVLRIGRLDGESWSNEGRDAKKSESISFRSKVVSRVHAQIWCDENGQVRSNAHFRY